ncbi:hypothetical protein [Pseudoalteromonas luteoviolacea]|uniref:Integrating conjugative element protein n=1 Tax=Pseudoalteromonas luteoviolacea S4060-1 TaxID=1365257 RepID=A0A167KWF0_9GAMM|nr:hypothetical protein [Pseudoalteromonas luteoviolacea]KZN63398.1 hypothetical protein N478_03855 [Pseudoalteromonas luteoviolacea S4060-1]
MKLKLPALLISTLLVSITFESNANTTLVLEEQDVSLTYKIHGASYWSRQKENELPVNLPDLQWNIGADCSGFDAGISVEGLMNDLDSQFNRLQRDTVNAMKGFATSLPLLLIQRMDPGLYELINNGIIKGEELFNLSISSCQSMSEKFSSNGFGALIDESTYYEFSSSLMSDPDKDETDIVKKMNEKGESKGEAGVPRHGGGTCGERKSNPCKPVEDVVKAGIKIAYEKSLKQRTKVNEPKPWIKNVFTDSSEAEGWITKTIGTVKYGTCKKCIQYEEVAGVGVYEDIASESLAISERLSAIVESSRIPDRSDLLSVSVNDMFVDENVIFALRDEQIHRGVFISRISDDLALMKVVDKLIAARRILLAGKSDPKFQSVTMNKEIIEARLQLISEEIRMLKEELELKASAKGDVIVQLLDRFKVRKNVDVNQIHSHFNKDMVDNLNRVSGRGEQ